MKALVLLAMMAATAFAQSPVPTTAPEPCGGDRFVLDSSAFPPDAIIPGGSRIAVFVLDDQTASVDIPGCTPALGTASIRRKATIVRAKIQGCSLTPFRVRLRLRPLCASLSGTTRQRGAVVASFTGVPAFDDDSPPPPDDVPPADDALPAAEPDLDVVGFAVSDDAPRITGFTPGIAEPGAVITIQGQNFNRERDGATWSGTPPWTVVFRQANRPGLLRAVFTVTSSTQLSVTVPESAGTGRVMLMQAARIFSEQSLFGGSLVDFVVDRDDAVVDPAPPADQPAEQIVLRVVNASQYDLVDLRLNGQQVVTSDALVTPPGAALEIPFVSGGQVQIETGTGFGIGDVLFTFATSRVIGAGTTIVNVPAVGISQLLANFGASRDWSTDLFVGDDGQFHTLTLRFFASGSWQHIVDGAQVAESGFTSLVSWPANGLTVQFGLRPNEVVSMPFPWSSFLFRGLVYTAQ